jgi:hypothetical protein
MQVGDGMATAKQILAAAAKLRARARQQSRTAIPVLWPPSVAPNSELTQAEKTHFADRVLRERGGLPREWGAPPRSNECRVRELRWQAERFAEIAEWDSQIAELVMRGEASLHFAIMFVRRQTRQYVTDYGNFQFAADRLVLELVDPSVQLRPVRFVSRK